MTGTRLVDSIRREISAQKKQLWLHCDRVGELADTVERNAAIAASANNRAAEVRSRLAASDENVDREDAVAQRELESARPLLEEARSSVANVRRAELEELRGLRLPPEVVKRTLSAVVALLSLAPPEATSTGAELPGGALPHLPRTKCGAASLKRSRSSLFASAGKSMVASAAMRASAGPSPQLRTPASSESWEAVRSWLRREDFIARVLELRSEALADAPTIDLLRVQRLCDIGGKGALKPEAAARASRCCGPLCTWLLHQLRYAAALRGLRRIKDRIRELKAERAALDAELANCEADAAAAQRSEAEAKAAHATALALVVECEANIGELQRRLVAAGANSPQPKRRRRRELQSGASMFDLLDDLEVAKEATK